MTVIWIKEANFPTIAEDLCCAIGNFDGVHLGHQELIKKSKEFNCKSAVLTFYPHPFTILKQVKPYRQLTPIRHKIKIIESLGIDYLFIVDFNDKVCNMNKDEFINNLKCLGIKKVVCGYDFTFARMAEGTTKDLAKSFEFFEVPKYQIDNVRVSTTYIKELLMIGDVEDVKKMLGRPYSIIGKIVGGKRLGSKIGFPTANIAYDIYYLPKNGVYASKITVRGKTYIAMTNVGVNPTVDFSEEIKIESHIFDFNEDIYGEEVEVTFDKRIRAEKKFEGVDELANQLKCDKIEIRNFYEDSQNK